MKRIKEDFIGILETSLIINVINNQKEIIKEDNINLHILYSLWNDNFIARNLDTDLFEKIAIQEITEKYSTINIEFISNLIIEDITKRLIVNIIDSFEYYKKHKTSEPFNYSGEEYWGIFRNIRNIRDTVIINNLFYIENKTDFKTTNIFLADNIQNYLISSGNLTFNHKEFDIKFKLGA